MRGSVQIHGLEPRQGETAFAFLVLRLTRPMQRAELVEVIRHVAPMIPDAEAILAGFSDELDEEMQLVGVPWTPPEQAGLGEQRALLEGAAARGVEAAWCFQTGTSLPPTEEEEDDDDDDDGHEDHGSNGERTNGAGEARLVAEPSLAKLAASTDESWDDLLAGDVTDPHTPQLHLEDAAGEDDDEDDEDDDADDADDEDDDDGEDDDEAWSHGPPPQRTEVPFPVEGYPAILDELDWEDFGISFKLAGPFTPGESTVLLGFHALWLAPYGGRYRNAAVTIDRRHHAAHLWVDRFAVLSSPEEQVGHLLWVLSKLHEVTPVLHARFGGATMSQKYAGLLGDSSEPFVLGGNPLLAIYEESGESGVDLWIAEQTDWSADEAAQMLREIADRIMEVDDEGEEEEEDEAAVDGAEDEEEDEDEVADEDVPELDEDELAEEVDEDEDDADEDEDEDVDEDVEEVDEDDLGRDITTYAGELLIARARAGLLDARAAESLRPLLAIADPGDPEGRRTAAIGILGALRDRASVPAMIQLLDERRHSSAPDANDTEALLAETAAALGAIGDPAAIPALARLAAAPGPHGDRHRPAAAAALAACLAAAPEPRDVDDAVVGALLGAIRERDDDALHAELTVAYGQLARQLPPPRRDDVRRRLAETAPACDDVMAKLARHAALVLASSGGPLDAGTAAAMRPLLHAALTELAADHASTVRNIRIALRVAELLPELVAPADLIALTRLPEPDVRERAHALLERLHHGMQPARCFDPLAVRELPEGELVERLGDPHVVGRAALAGEIARRGLHGGRSAVCAAVQDAIERAPSGEQRLLAPDARLLEVAIPWLREGELDGATIALFDRILRHGNPHVKWDLLEEPPEDARLLGGMFYVLSERWSWQEEAARDWLRGLEGTAAFEAARRRAGVASLDPADDEDDDEADDAAASEDDEEMN